MNDKPARGAYVQVSTSLQLEDPHGPASSSASLKWRWTLAKVSQAARKLNEGSVKSWYHGSDPLVLPKTCYYTDKTHVHTFKFQVGRGVKNENLLQLWHFSLGMHLNAISGSHWQVEILDPLPLLSQMLTELCERACGSKYLSARVRDLVARSLCWRRRRTAVMSCRVVCIKQEPGSMLVVQVKYEIIFLQLHWSVMQRVAQTFNARMYR